MSKTLISTRLLILGLAVISIFSSTILKENRSAADDYISLNNSEKRLWEYRDNNETLLLKLKQLEVINKSRAKYKAPPVKLDILASRVANRMCTEAAKGHYISHWNEAGEKPYHRYAFAGGVDHVSENASGESFTGSYEVNTKVKTEMMQRFHSIFMAEKPPADGHKLNVIDKAHNYVGIGLYMDEHEFRYYEEFIDRYLVFNGDCTLQSKGRPFNIDVDVDEGYFLCYLTAFFEKDLRKKSPGELTRTGSYDDYTNIVATKIDPWKLAAYRKGSNYQIPISFDKPGYYYIHLYLDTKEPGNSGSFTTRGKIQASGLVIKVL